MIQRFLTGMPVRFETASGDLRLHAVVVDADEATGRARRIETLSLSMADLERLADEWPDDEKAAAGRA